jgi:hypothetical protein
VAEIDAGLARIPVDEVIREVKELERETIKADSSLRSE